MVKVKRLSKKRHQRDKSYSIYIYRVLRSVHRNIFISKASMEIMNSFVNDMFEKIITETANLVKYNNKNTLNAKDIQTAVRLLLSGELSKYACTEGSKAVARYKSGDDKSLLTSFPTKSFFFFLILCIYFYLFIYRFFF
jgi:histone H2B